MSSEPELDDQVLPVNLHFRDERVLTVDIDAVMNSGRRMRRDRMVLAGVGAAAVIGVSAVSVAYLVPTASPSASTVGSAPSSSPAASSSPQPSDKLDSLLAGGGHVTVLGSRPNPMAGFTLSAVAWRAGRQICYGTANLAGSVTSSTITCANRPSALSATTPTALAPNLIAGVTDDTGARVAIGFVSGDVATVSWKIRGHLYDATVVALPGSPSTGAYMAWIDSEDAGSSAPEFTQITGYDSRGNVVTG